MGAPASVKIRTPLNVDQELLLSLSATLAAQIENEASLYIENSQVSILNSEGSISKASRHLIKMIDSARQVSEVTNGAFDISVQPLWELASVLAIKDLSQQRAEDLWAEARSKVDFRAIEVDGESVRFTKPGMKITLNGIAQGYVTERVSTLLQEQGVEHGLVNFGEYKGFGKNENGKPWRVGIQNPLNVMDNTEIVELHNEALATSAASAGQVGDQISHIFDARTGRKMGAKSVFASASVLHSSATLADAYATAFTLMNAADIGKIVQSHPGMRAILVRKDGEIVRI